MSQIDFKQSIYKSCISEALGKEQSRYFHLPIIITVASL